MGPRLLVALVAASQLQGFVEPTLPTAADSAYHASWLDAPSNVAPFTLALGGVPFNASRWTQVKQQHQLSDRRIEVTTWTDPSSSLVINVTRTTYSTTPATESVLRLTNTGQSNTPVITGLRLLASFEAGTAPFGLLWSRGSNANILDYTPYSTDLDVNESLQFSPTGGRSSNANVPPVDTPEARSHSLPFWRVTVPGKGGAIVALGWSGQWLTTWSATSGASFSETYPGRIVPPVSATAVARGPLVLNAGQQYFASYLKPGESVRTPSLVVMTHAEPVASASPGPVGARAHNLWRRLMIDHFTPRTADGELAWMPVAPSAGQLTDWANETNQLLALQHLGEHNHSFTQYTNTWWMDAGLIPGGFEHNGNWQASPNITYDQKRFPNGLKPVADAVHAVGLKLLIWHEPERVLTKTTLAQLFPTWMLSSAADPNTLLLDLSNAEVLKWLIGWIQAEVPTPHNISKHVDEVDYDLYRQDFNMDPLSYWLAKDNCTSPDPSTCSNRLGFTEAKYIEHEYAYLDAIAGMKNGQMVLGDCASGGRRLDIEMLRRMTVNSRSDNCMDPLSSQGYTYALSRWIPRHGQSATGAKSVLEPTMINTDNDYSFKSFMGTSMGFDYDWYYASSNATWWTRVGEWLARYQSVRWAFSATSAVDFYPLTEHCVDDRSWIAWQFDQMHNGRQRGMIQVFRQVASSVSQATLPVYALDRDKRYCLSSWDDNLQNATSVPGATLMETGLRVTLLGVTPGMGNASAAVIEIAEC